MKNRFNFGFFVSAVACAIILNALSVGDLKFALHKLGPLLQGDIHLRDQVAAKCGSLVSSGSATEKYVLERLPIPARESDPAECTLVAQSSQVTRLRLRSFRDFQIQVRDSNGTPLAERHFAVEFPRPLVLLPLVLFLLALVFEYRRWGIGATVGSYVFLACGANLIQCFGAVAQGVHTVFFGEQSWMGMFLVLFWVALCRGQRQPLQPPAAVSAEGRWLNRALLGAIGLWNPAAFTLGGRLLVPFRGNVARVAPFFAFQVVAVCLSVYLLTLGTDGLRSFFSVSIWMPRYFTFGTLLFLFLQHEKPTREPLVWHLPGVWRTLLFIGSIELWAFYSHFWDGTSHLTRLGVALVASQLAWPRYLQWRRVGKDTARWGTALLLSALLTVFSTQSGTADLVLLALDPRMHPTGTVFFTFLSGIGLGFVTGGFAVAFFALFMAMMKTGTVPLVHAALLDGIVAGILLSPFSVFNLVSATQFGLSPSAVVAHRFRQLAFPLAIGLLIYAVSAITSVAILRPATFIFLCLVAVVIHLKKSSWKFGNYTISPGLHSGAH